MSITMWGAEQLALVRSARAQFEVTEEQASSLPFTWRTHTAGSATGRSGTR